MKFKTIQTDMITALKAGDKFRKETLSNLIAAIKLTAINKNIREDISDELVNETILKEKKSLQEMIDTCPAERDDLRDKYTLQMIIIDEYCPKVLEDPVKIAEFIDLLILEHPGINMKTMMPMLKGKVDMKTASKIVKEKL